MGNHGEPEFISVDDCRPPGQNMSGADFIFYSGSVKRETLGLHAFYAPCFLQLFLPHSGCGGQHERLGWI